MQDLVLTLNQVSQKFMSSLSVMEWNAKPPLQSEWKKASAPSTSKAATEKAKIWSSIKWGMDVDDQIASRSLMSYQGDCGSGVSSAGTNFDIGYASMSKNSNSSSMSSSSTEDKKIFKLSVESAGNVSEDFIFKKDEFSRTSPALESSVCSGEPMLSLKLGKRAYFEDTSGGSNSKTTSASPLIIRSSAKRTRSTFQNTSAACCQVEGCKFDLSSAKDYHRKHKVCVNHSKSPKVIVNGVERRFCQQCSRFHGLAEFDVNKRSCRKRLSDHNARRRRPHPIVAHFNPTSGLQQVSPVFSRIPVEQNSKSSSNITWSNTLSSINFKSAAVKHESVWGHLAEATRHGNMLLPDSIRRRAGTHLSDDQLLPLNGASVKVHGREETFISSSMDSQPPQYLHRALSLLSTDARDSSQSRSVPVSAQGLHRQANNITTGIVKPWPPPDYSAPTGLWHAEEQWSSSSQRLSMNFNNGNAFQEGLLSEEQHEFGFDLMHIN